MNNKIKCKLNKRTAILAITLVVMMLAAVAGTLALLSAKSETKENTFTPYQLTCEVEMSSFYGYPESIYVKNTGDTQGYVRVRIVANWVIDDEDDPDNGAICPEMPVENTDYRLSGYSSYRWTRLGEYFYCKRAVDAGNKSDELIGHIKQLKKKSGYRLKFTVLAQIVQSDPADAVQEAWHVKYNEETSEWESI